MGDNSGDEYVPPPRIDNFKKVSLLPLVFLIFYEVFGGPFGVEDTVGAAGPLLALLGFLIFLFTWSIPKALIIVEMGTMFLRIVSAILALGSGLPRILAMLALTVVLTYMNYRGLTIVG
ncbi:putative polyamine transporter [Quercus suber]|uniref:Polyamine transporter n=1 Tax=Quercus suber TaxID=58331 RepID=A0AAW0LIF4_QUESU